MAVVLVVTGAVPTGTALSRARHAVRVVLVAKERLAARISAFLSAPSAVEVEITARLVICVCYTKEGVSAVPT